MGGDMAIRIEKTYQVDAPIERLWAFLTDPESVVPCIPGASVDEMVDERSFRGRVAVKVGPVEAKYKGDARFEELDVDNYRMRLVAQGKGLGSARLVMTSQLRPLDGGGTEASVIAEVNLSGRLVQFGSRMINVVSDQLFDQFVKRVQDGVQAADG
jgi:carbon monoxide dehydrogenase subunit G